MESKQENKKNRQLRIKAQMKENLLKRKTLVKLRVRQETSSIVKPLGVKGRDNG